MAYDFEVRVNGVIKLAGQIEDIPRFVIDGKIATTTAVFLEDLPVPDVPLINQHDILGALNAEGESPEGSDQGAEDDAPKQRRGGRRKDEPEAEPETEPAAEDPPEEGEPES